MTNSQLSSSQKEDLVKQNNLINTIRKAISGILAAHEITVAGWLNESYQPDLIVAQILGADSKEYLYVSSKEETKILELKDK